MFNFQTECTLCGDTKTGVHTRMGHACLDCLVSTYEEALGEEEQDNEWLNGRLGMKFGL